MTEQKDWHKRNTLAVSTATSKLKIESAVLKYQIKCGNIESQKNRILKSTFELIQKQESEYISITNFIMEHDNERFNARLAQNRNKYIDFLETNEYFGVKLYPPEEIMLSQNSDEYFIKKEDADFIDYKSVKFFREYGFTEKEKNYRIINNISGHKLTIKYINNYIDYFDDGSNKYTSTMTSFVETMFTAGDVRMLTDEDIVTILENCNALRTKELIVGFIKYISRFENVKYSKIDLEKPESRPVSAYSYDFFINLAKILFNTEYDKQNSLTEKSLNNNFYAEMWLFLAIHFICGWRASDICTNWVYPNLKSDENPFVIKLDTLKDDILQGKINEKTFESIALYAIKKIEMSFNLPSKNSRSNVGKLRSEIVPELRVLFGKLILIAELHQLNSDDGYMKASRISRYCNWTYCREFFGEDMYLLTGRQNILSRRLNKSYLQGIEQATIDNGNTTLVAHIVASLARNHANIDTTAIYLKDHGLTGESAEVVLYMMMQRGVFGVSLYHSLISAYPEAFGKLTAKDQTELMEKIPLTAYELETTGTVMIAKEKIYNKFSQGKTKEPIEILKAMYSIGQGRGKSKDAGVFCMKKALGESCVYPLYESCLANLCEYHVFTNEGIPSLIRVVKEYREKAIKTGNKKYEVALYKMIIPAFQDIINAIIKEMSKDEKKSIKLLLSEALNE